MKTDVVIIGGGPSGLLLSQLLNRNGVETVILERATRDHVLSRIRAGVLEWGTVDMLAEAGVDARLRREGLPHDGCHLADGDNVVRIDFFELTGRRAMIYGQTEVTKDLYAAQDEMGTTIIHGADDVAIHEADTDAPYVTYRRDGQEHRVDCAYIAGCDGYHGVSRRTIPEDIRSEFERVYPFGWLGILSPTPPLHHELIYAHSERGFALASMRNENLSRNYIQVPLSDRVEDWSDDAFWAEFKRRMPASMIDSLVTGASVEKSIAPLRSFVSEPMRWGRLFLVGDAAHIVPPTGAKGLNLAVSDVHYLQEALIAAVKAGDTSGIDAYSDRALARIWKAMRFSWQMTTMMHRFEGEDSFALQMRRADLAHLARSETARRDFAENYIGLPF